MLLDVGMVWLLPIACARRAPGAATIDPPPPFAIGAARPPGFGNWPAVSRFLPQTRYVSFPKHACQIFFITGRGHSPYASDCPLAAGVTAPSPASFDLCADGGIGGLKRRLRPRRTASGDAKEREQDDENANCSPMVGHHSLIRVSQLAARKRRDYATILTKINRPSQARRPVARAPRTALGLAPPRASNKS